MQKVFIDDQELIVEDVDFCDSHLVMMVREGRTLGLCSVLLPLPSGQVRNCSLRLQPYFYYSGLNLHTYSFVPFLYTLQVSLLVTYSSYETG